MKHSVQFCVSFLLITQSCALQLRDCNETCTTDSCGWAVTGAHHRLPPAPSVRQADCSSFLASTILPPAITATITVFVFGNGTTNQTSTSVSTPPFANVTTSSCTDIAYAVATGGSGGTAPIILAPTSIPTYASACPDCAAYSSACSCLGVNPTTTTAPTTTYTVTISIIPTTSLISTTSSSSSATASPTGPTPPFTNGTTSGRGTCSDPGVCQTFSPFGAPGDDCWCGVDTDGTAISFQAEVCDTDLGCTSNDDCSSQFGSAWSCLTSNCCEFNICSRTDVCADTSTGTAMMLREKKRKLLLGSDGKLKTSVNPATGKKV